MAGAHRLALGQQHRRGDRAVEPAVGHRRAQLRALQVGADRGNARPDRGHHGRPIGGPGPAGFVPAQRGPDIGFRSIARQRCRGAALRRHFECDRGQQAACSQQADGVAVPCLVLLGVVLLAEQEGVGRHQRGHAFADVGHRRSRRAGGQRQQQDDGGDSTTHATILSHSTHRRMTKTFPARVGMTLLLALAAALLCRWLRTPLPWMIGPLLATGVASMLGQPTRSFGPFRNAGQAIIGTALGLYFTPQVTALVASLWWAIVLAIAWALGLGWAFGHWLHRAQAGRFGGTPAQQRATSYFAGAIGGASEMTLLAERAGARTDLVAAAHSLRLLIVTLVVPFGFTLAGLHGLDPTLPGARVVHWGGLAVLGMAALAGAKLMQRTGRANPWFIGALLVAMGLTMAGIELSAMPQWLTNTAQLLIGVSLGVRFSAGFMRTAPRWLGSVAAGTLGMIGLCAAFAVLLAWATGLHWATLILGTSPGGIAEMAITAKVLQLGVPVVTAFQVCRLVAVLMLVEPLYRWGFLR